MSRGPVKTQLFLNDGLGNPLPIQTGVFATKAISVDEHRRLSLTIGVQGSTGVAGGGFTGVLQIQGTDELGQCNGATGTQIAGSNMQPGTNGFTGALFWTPIQSGTLNITNALNTFRMDINDVNPQFVRVVFNMTATGPIAGVNGGSGTMFLYLTAKNA